jgi:hypothetical protein
MMSIYYTDFVKCLLRISAHLLFGSLFFFVIELLYVLLYIYLDTLEVLPLLCDWLVHLFHKKL